MTLWQSLWTSLPYLLGVVAAGIAVVGRQTSRLKQQTEHSRRLEQEVARRTDELETQNRALAELNRKLREVSLTDSLTGLGNRRYLADQIPKDLALIRRARFDDRQEPNTERVAPDPNILFLMVDLDGLKRVNDTSGHQAGDRTIVQMKEILVRVCRQSDTVIRWGGDEFLLLGRQTERGAAPQIAERIRQAVEAHRFDLGNGDTVHLTCSIGFTFFPFVPSAPGLFGWEQVLDLADRALYRAKRGGRNRYVGVTAAPDSDPAVVIQRKDDDLDQLHRDGIIELLTGASSGLGRSEVATHLNRGLAPLLPFFRPCAPEGDTQRPEV